MFKYYYIFLAMSSCIISGTGCANVGTQSQLRNADDAYKVLQEKCKATGEELTRTKMEVEHLQQVVNNPANTTPSALQSAWDETVRISTEAWDSQVAKDARARLSKAMQDLTESVSESKK